MDILCDGHFGFVNCTREALIEDYPVLLPSNRTIVEVLENIPADSEVIEACRRLRKAGTRGIVRRHRSLRRDALGT